MEKLLGYVAILGMLCLSGCTQEQVEPKTKEPLSVPSYMVDITDEVYKSVITELVETNIFPVSNFLADGMPFKQTYAVVDIDEDGKEELLINYSGANSMAGTVYYIYDYDWTTGEVYIEHLGWPDVTFYDNGYVKEEASHNHGRSNLDDFWPYQIIVYNAEKDIYESITHVDAWQKDIIPKDFPEEADKDGDGIVFYTAPSSYTPTAFMDKAEYDSWCEKYNNGVIKKIHWKPIMTEEEYNVIYRKEPIG